MCDGGSLKVVPDFCYLGDTVSASGGADRSVSVRVRSVRKKFRELLLLLSSRTLPLSTKGRLFDACVRSVRLYGSETWATKVDDLQKLERNDMRMIRWICNVSLKDGHSSDQLRDRLKLDRISDCVQKRRLRWFGHLERMEEDNWVSKCRHLEVAGSRGRGRPRKTWDEVVQRDLLERGLGRDLARNRCVWKRVTCTRPTHVDMDNRR